MTEEWSTSGERFEVNCDFSAAWMLVVELFKQRGQLLWILWLTACNISRNCRRVILLFFTKAHVHVHQFQAQFSYLGGWWSPPKPMFYTHVLLPTILHSPFYFQQFPSLGFPSYCHHGYRLNITDGRHCLEKWEKIITSKDWFTVLKWRPISS